MLRLKDLTLRLKDLMLRLKDLTLRLKDLMLRLKDLMLRLKDQAPCVQYLSRGSSSATLVCNQSATRPS
jgi:hypothetical protein